MTCLLNYSPAEQSELQWLADEAAVQHKWAQESHDSMFSSQTGHLRKLQLADSLTDTLWAMSMVRSRTFSDQVCKALLVCLPACIGTRPCQYVSSQCRFASELDARLCLHQCCTLLLREHQLYPCNINSSSAV